MLRRLMLLSVAGLVLASGLTSVQGAELDRFKGDWKTLAERIISNMPPDQTPRLTLIGRAPEMLAAQGPFSI